MHLTIEGILHFAGENSLLTRFPNASAYTKREAPVETGAVTKTNCL